jgi:YHS domain-containing protein
MTPPSTAWSRSGRAHLFLLALIASLCALPACLGPRFGADRGLVNLDDHGVALHGYDPVTYFAEGGGIPRIGRSEHTVRYEGVLYRFIGSQNVQRFQADPERYVPAYGGFSAWEMVDGNRQDIDPTSFLIQDGKLLLFYSGPFSNGRTKWQQRDGRELRERADRAWFALLSKER